MKNKILFALLVLVVTFSLVGCGPSASQFVGKWESYSPLIANYTYELKEDGTYSFITDYTWLGSNIEHGTWVWNGDNTATLTDEDGNEITATRDTEKEIDEKTGEETDNLRAFLLINDTKYYRVKEEVNDEE